MSPEPNLRWSKPDHGVACRPPRTGSPFPQSGHPDCAWNRNHLGRTLVNDRAICPKAAFPTIEIQEHVPETESIRTTRVAVNLLGDGFVEAVADRTFLEMARNNARRHSTKSADRCSTFPSSKLRGKPALGGSAGRISKPPCYRSQGTP